MTGNVALSHGEIKENFYLLGKRASFNAFNAQVLELSDYLAQRGLHNKDEISDHLDLERRALGKIPVFKKRCLSFLSRFTRLARPKTLTDRLSQIQDDETLLNKLKMVDPFELSSIIVCAIYLQKTAALHALLWKDSHPKEFGYKSDEPLMHCMNYNGAQYAFIATHLGFCNDPQIYAFLTEHIPILLNDFYTNSQKVKSAKGEDVTYYRYFDEFQEHVMYAMEKNNAQYIHFVRQVLGKDPFHFMWIRRAFDIAVTHGSGEALSALLMLLMGNNGSVEHVIAHRTLLTELIRTHKKIESDREALALLREWVDQACMEALDRACDLAAKKVKDREHVNPLGAALPHSG